MTTKSKHHCLSTPNRARCYRTDVEKQTASVDLTPLKEHPNLATFTGETLLMPTYDYKCDACGTEFTKEQRITEKPSKKCLKCGKMKARRMISESPGFILKGGGWESDLYSGPSNESKTKKEDSVSKSESKTKSKDTKPASKSPPKKGN